MNDLFQLCSVLWYFTLCWKIYLELQKSDSKTSASGYWLENLTVDILLGSEYSCDKNKVVNRTGLLSNKQAFWGISLWQLQALIVMSNIRWIPFSQKAPCSVSFQLHRKRLFGFNKSCCCHTESNMLQYRYRNNTCSLCPTEHNSMNCWVQADKFQDYLSSEGIRVFFLDRNISVLMPIPVYMDILQHFVVAVSVCPTELQGLLVLHQTYSFT